MSYTELLEAVRALPREKQRQLIEAIGEDFSERRLADRVFGKEFQSYEMQSDVWFPNHEPDAVDAVLRAMNNDGSEVV